MSYFDDDYEEYEEPDQDEEETMDSTAKTEVKAEGENLKIEFNTSNFVNGIMQAVVSELKGSLKKEILDELKKDILGSIKNEIQDSTTKITEEIVREIYETETIKIGGGWDKEPKEYTVKSYIMEQIKESFKDGEVKIKKKDRYGDTRTQSVSFTDWVTEECVTSEIQKHIDKQMEETRNSINKKVKEIFDDSTRKMLSENVLSILMANDTYRKLENNIACIASRAETI